MKNRFCQKYAKVARLIGLRWITQPIFQQQQTCPAFLCVRNLPRSRRNCRFYPSNLAFPYDFYCILGSVSKFVRHHNLFKFWLSLESNIDPVTGDVFSRYFAQLLNLPKFHDFFCVKPYFPISFIIFFLALYTVYFSWK